MKFVVFKGTAGWGDRLQCLLQIIKYVKATGRYLVLDWRDEEWSHDGRLTLDQYFEFGDDVRHFPLSAFLALYQSQETSMSVVPKAWRGHMLSTNIRHFVYKDLFRTVEHGKQFDDIAEYRIDDFDEDVVVYSGTGFRAFAYSDFSCLKPNAWLRKELKAFAQKAGLVRGAYDVVHLRAGSKKWAGGKVSLVDLAQKIDKKFPDLATYLDQLQTTYESKCCDEVDRLPLKVLSDSAWLADAWIQNVGNGVFLNHHMDSKMVGSGIHEAGQDDLKAFGIDKFSINLDSLRDFAVMLNARHIVFDGVSLFSKMAENCKGNIDSGWVFSDPSACSI